MVAGLLLVCTSARAQQDFSPANRERGRAAVEYRDKAAHIVAAYYYSQRHHDSRWIVIDSALSMEERSVLHREAFALRTPGGARSRWQRNHVSAGTPSTSRNCCRTPASRVTTCCRTSTSAAGRIP